MSVKTRKTPEGLRGRVLLVFQDYLHAHPGGRLYVKGVQLSRVARELGVSRQRVYRACPELRTR